MTLLKIICLRICVDTGRNKTVNYTLLTMIERWKMSIDNKGFTGGVLMDLTKAFYTINHQLLIAKLNTYGFDREALELILSYLNNCWHRTKINISFSSWAEVMCRVIHGSILGPPLLNVYINDLFYEFLQTNVCTIADDTTPYACNIDLPTLLRNLKNDSLSAIIWQTT